MKTYETPELIKYGTIDELTQASGPGLTDAIAPGSEDI
jgi:hypothetical protein